MKKRVVKGQTATTTSGTFHHAGVVAPKEPEHRPPPASRLPSWVIEDRPRPAARRLRDG